VENNSSNGNAYVMDNFLYGNYGLNNLSHRNNQVEIMVTNTNQSNYFPFNISQEIKPLNFGVPDEVSCISPLNYYKRINMNKNNKGILTSRKTQKVRKRSNVVKGQWTVEEDGYIKT
jgi:myb proto-oncogene protein